jgi:hypothetical protein
MRHLKTSLWDLTANSKVGRHLDKLLPAVMPGIGDATSSQPVGQK